MKVSSSISAYAYSIFSIKIAGVFAMKPIILVNYRRSVHYSRSFRFSIFGDNTTDSEKKTHVNDLMQSIKEPVTGKDILSTKMLQVHSSR